MIKRFTAIILAVLVLGLSACNSIEDAVKDAVSDSGLQTDNPQASEPPSETPNPGTGFAAVGNVIQFAGYDWRVLDVQDGKALILSDKVLEQRKFHTENNADLTWADSSIRQYLNGEFFDSLPADERIKITETRVENNDNLRYETSGGSDTNDKIFLLSLEEVVRYFGDSGQWENSPESASTINDEYNSARTAATLTNSQSAWWLRTPGQRMSNRMSFVHIPVDGTIIVGGYSTGNVIGVRPALWLDLED
ncbi:MAG: DUF6273 domain-containing protein [Oscillospiraceae bacterium]|nr:DUF6273 domain-containing protein [Oscillospiraceae bacterium]